MQRVIAFTLVSGFVQKGKLPGVIQKILSAADQKTIGNRLIGVTDSHQTAERQTFGINFINGGFNGSAVGRNMNTAPGIKKA